ncbi:MAG: hypothetical protein GVY09_11145 [Gammaproteobacteria bacterium]|jgi:hypothetical protein|nr:hypothetical protein [Gammaproteobacteria bacterium]
MRDPVHTRILGTRSNPLRVLAARLVSHVLGMLAYSCLSPVVVSYTVLVLGTLGLGLVVGGINEQGSSIRDILGHLFSVADGAWADFVWRGDLSFEQNALRLFGGLGFLLWLMEQAIRPWRRAPRAQRRPTDQFKRLWSRLGMFTAVLCTFTLAAALIIGPGGQDLTLGWALQAVVTLYLMGALLLLGSTPALAGWLFLQHARRRAAAAIIGAEPPSAAAAD